MHTAGIFIVFDYLGQRKEELDAEDEEARKNPTFVVQAPPPAAGPSMRTTYDAAPYDPAANPNGGGWASSKTPYGFNMPETGQVAGPPRV